MQAGLVEQHGTRGGAYYTLSVPAEVKVEVTPPAQTDEEKILAYVQKHGSITNSKCRELLNVGSDRPHYLLRKLCDAGQLKPVGENRWRKYVAP